MFVDFHSHILPQIDDGSRSIEESVQILELMAEDAVDVVVATPHFYFHEMSVSHFIERRNRAYEKLVPYLKPTYPKILLGAEALYSSALVDSPDLEKLCIQGTDYLLLEMPYIKLTRSIIDGVEELADSGRVSVMVAHIERYLNYTDYSDLEKLMSLDVIGQLNSRSFENRKTKKNCFRLFKQGFAHVMGTDFHRIDRGDLPLSFGYECIAKKFSDSAADRLMNNSSLVLDNRDMDEIILG